MVLTLMIPCRNWMGLQHLITLNHLDNIAKILLATGTMVGYAYAMEFFIAWYSGVQYEQYAFTNRAFGPYWWAYWTMISCNVISPQFFWFRSIRRNPTALFIISIFVNIGMWFERFVITVTSLHRDFLPSSWGYFSPTIVDMLTYLGSFGLFFTMFLLFCRFLPVIAISEVKGVMPEADPHHEPPAKKDPAPAPQEANRVKTYAAVAEFDSAYAIYHAAEKATGEGYTKLDAHTPFPIHGLDKALKQGDSHLGWLCLVWGHHRHHRRPGDDVVDERGGLPVLGVRQAAVRLGVDHARSPSS